MRLHRRRGTPEADGSHQKRLRTTLDAATGLFDLEKKLGIPMRLSDIG
jgi:hypothetical protein